MTTLEKLIRANRWRIRTGQKLANQALPPELASDDTDGWNGSFLVPLDGQLWHVRISDGMGWRHLSVTSAQKRIYPGWETMARLKDLFFGDDSWAVQFHPAKDACVNDHPYCLHIWQPLEADLPTPPIILV